jgi:lysine 2,3-aminomutase
MDWKTIISEDICDINELEGFDWLADTKDLKKVTKQFPMRITPYYMGLIDKSDPNDPIARMCIPSLDELHQSGSFDTSGEKRNTKQRGLQHKYRQTALILSTNVCAMYCRHCFRKRMVGLTDEELAHQLDLAVDYVKSHPEITNILISGGDSLMLPDRIIERYLEEFTKLDNLDLIRFGSRVPVVFPERIDENLIAIFRKHATKKQIYLVTQYNHPHELTEQSIRAIKAFRDIGIQVRNQTVLLHGVNDKPKVLGELLRGLTRNGIVPYYIFQCRPVTGVRERFQIPIMDGVRIVDEAKAMQSGIGKSIRYIMSHPRGKIEILGTQDDGTTLFKFHQSHSRKDESKIFTSQLTPKSTWLDEDLNAI